MKGQNFGAANICASKVINGVQTTQEKIVASEGITMVFKARQDQSHRMLAEAEATFAGRTNVSRGFRRGRRATHDFLR